VTNRHRRKNVTYVLLLDFSDKSHTTFSILLQSHVCQNVQILLSSWVVKFIFRNQNRSGPFAEKQNSLIPWGNWNTFPLSSGPLSNYYIGWYNSVLCKIALEVSISLYFSRTRISSRYVCMWVFSSVTLTSEHIYHDN